MLESAFTGWVDERIEDCYSELKKQGMFFAKDRHVRELREKLDGLQMGEADMAMLQAYLQEAFERDAKLQPAIYRQGVADGIRLMRLLDVL